MPTTGNYFHLHLVSDSTGETLITVARAVAAQYANVTPVEHVYPLVRSQKQLDRVLDEIEEAPGIVLFTLLEKDLVARLEAKCKEMNIPSLSIIGPVMQLFQAYLGAATTGRVGAQHVLNAEYFKRIDALNYTMMHDDGQHVEGLEEAEVILVGVSRTSKTPTSIYLANRGIRTANVPLVPGIPIPHQLETLKKPLVVSLHATPERLIQVRQNRLLSMGDRDNDTYIDRQSVTDEVAFARKLSAQIQLGAARCDAAIDRRDGGGNPETVHRPAAAADFRMTLWRGKDPLILASQSRARQMLLANAGIHFEAVPADIDERAVQQASGLSAPGEIAALLAREKALDVSRGQPGKYVVGADQTLALETRLFSKPSGREAAAEQLRDLAGHSHELHSAVAVARDGKILFESTAIARMTMRQLSGAEIQTYLDEAGEAVTSSVGAYQLEGLGVHLFERIDGDHFTILGLPLLPLLAFLRSERLLGV